MGIQQLFICDGCNKEGKSGVDFRADWSALPAGWRAFMIGQNTYHACNVECAFVAAKRILEGVFKQ